MTDKYQSMHVRPVVDLVLGELTSAVEAFSPFASPHEGYAVILEELDGLWDGVKRDDVTRARKQAIQVAAMAIRFLLDIAEVDS